MPLTHIDLFSGIGGFALAAQWAGFKTVAFCEIDPYCQEILTQNFRAVADDAQSPDGGYNSRKRKRQIQKFGKRTGPKLFRNIRSFPASAYRGATLLTGGFPCQPFSRAGERRGAEDHRYLWPEMLRVISEARPAWVLGENVAGIVTMELDRVLPDLEGEGYAVQALVIPACAVDAKHRRDRVWIVGHTEERTERAGLSASESGEQRRRRSGDADSKEDVADAPRIQQGWQEQWAEWKRVRKCGESIGMDTGCSLLQGRGTEKSAQWLPEPDVGRVAHGVPFRVDRLKGLGNAIVPQVAYEIIKEIAKTEKGILK